MQPYRFGPDGVAQQPLWAGNRVVLTAALLADSLAQPAVPGAGPGESPPTSQQGIQLATAQPGSALPARGASTQGVGGRPAPHPSPLPAGPGPASSCVALSAKYDLLGRIGEGTYGVVYLAASREQPGTRRRLFAIKTFKTGREGDGISPTAVREIMLLREIRHEHIVRLDSVHINRHEPSLSLAFDYAEHDLYEMIRHHRDRLQAPMDPYVVKSVMWQLLNGLSYMHQNWMIHRDLKPSNVLVMGEGSEQGCVKIGDFGLARFFQAPCRPLSDNGVVVTIWYRAPELLLGARHYTRAVDIWAVGAIFAELMTLRPLFQGVERKAGAAPFQGDQLDRIFRVLGHPSRHTWPHLEHLHHWRENADNVWAPRPEWGGNRLADHLADSMRAMADTMFRTSSAAAAATARPSAAAVDLLQRLLEYDPMKRITAADALKHEYFTREPPLPGANAFVTPAGIIVGHYPRRTKHSALTVAAGVGMGAPTAGAAAGMTAPIIQQVQPQAHQRQHVPVATGHPVVQASHHPPGQHAQHIAGDGVARHPAGAGQLAGQQQQHGVAAALQQPPAHGPKRAPLFASSSTAGSTVESSRKRKAEGSASKR